MTKEEKILLQLKENKAWEDLQRTKLSYVESNFPFGFGYIKAEMTFYDSTSAEVAPAMMIWVEYSTLLKELGIKTYVRSEKSREYIRKNMDWLEGIKK